ncbi:MAG: hypothetical protein JSS09_04945 [Verrucomicrobia bacterium]|nr:hypothetical protein [Verrucomicrobiota bacterium]
MQFIRFKEPISKASLIYLDSLLSENSSSQKIKLDLSSIKIGSNLSSLLDIAKKHPKICNLDLSYNNLDDKSAHLLATAIKTKNLFSNSAKKSFFGVFSDDPSKLSLAHNNIKDEGAISLAEIIASKRNIDINLSHNEIGAKGAEALVKAAVMANLEKIDLSHNENIGNEGAELISKALKENPGKITELILTKCNIGFAGDKALAENTPRQISVIHRSKTVPYMEAFPVISMFFTIFTGGAALFVLPFMTAEENIPGCEYKPSK